VPDEQQQVIVPEPPTAKPQRWNMADALLIVAMYLVALLLGTFAAMGIARITHHDPKTALQNIGVLLGIQFCGYLFAFLCARVVITLKTRAPFFPSIGWNFPGAERLPQMLLLGMFLAVFVSFASPLLPIPKKLPVEAMFSTRASALGTMIFATLIAPIAEELFFRGIFWGALISSLEDLRSRRRLAIALIVLAALFASLAVKGRGSAYAMFVPVLLVVGLLLIPLSRNGVPQPDAQRQTAIAVILTSLLFAFVHGTQLANSWAPVLMLLVVGLVLTGVRVRLNSVAASWLLHTGYNGTLFLLMWAGTAGFTRPS
jgi:membrane protease YdiL (CAAX protease family)